MSNSDTTITDRRPPNNPAPTVQTPTTMHGYSSSEESEDPRRPRAQPNTSNNNDQKKKRKKRLPPQQSINKIWKKFSNRKFHKALSVLPFDPVQPPAFDRQNEPLWDSYERASEECRRKVNKIVGECKRINMRYRDPGFDLVGYSFTRGCSLASFLVYIFKLVHELTFCRTGTSSMKRATVSTVWVLKSSSLTAPLFLALRPLCPRL